MLFINAQGHPIGKLKPIKHHLDLTTIEWLETERMTCVLWTSVPGDWLDAAGWVDKALADAEAQPTDVVVLHDVLEEASLHLDRFLDALVARGHTFTAALPPACLPIVDGVTQPGLRSFVAS